MQRSEENVWCFHRLQEAFDLVPHEALTLKLRAIGLSGNCLSFIEAVYDNSYVRVRVGTGHSERVKVERGV